MLQDLIIFVDEQQVAQLEVNQMPAQCDECNEEKGYDDVVNLRCELGYDHSICKDCMKSIKKKASKR